MPSTDVVEPPAKEDAQAGSDKSTASEAESRSTESKAGQPADEVQDFVTHPDTGQRINLKSGEKDWLAQQGYRALEREQQARRAVEEKPKEVEPEPQSEKEAVVQPEGTEDDAASERVAQLEAKLAKAQQALDGITERESERDRAKQVQDREDVDRRMLHELAKQHGVDGADPKDLRLIAHRANDIADEALRDGQVRTFASCYEEAKQELGQRFAKSDRAWLAEKKEAAKSAAEPPGSVSAAELPASAMPVTKADNRKLAAEMEDGTVTERAHQRFNAMMARGNV